jgi:hypothetical protein
LPLCTPDGKHKLRGIKQVFDLKTGLNTRNFVTKAIKIVMCRALPHLVKLDCLIGQAKKRRDLLSFPFQNGG